MSKKNILIIGEVFVDTHLDLTTTDGPFIRLGGIFHSIRALAAFGIQYSLAFYSADYLDSNILKYSKKLNATEVHKLGTIAGCPNILLVNDSAESGYQGYQNLLNGEATFRKAKNITEVITSVQPTDILFFPGRFDNVEILNSLKSYSGRVHIDMHYDSELLLKSIKQKIQTVVISTSSNLFKEKFHSSITEIINSDKQKLFERILLKENRGGSCCYELLNNQTHESPAFLDLKTLHSVGVGDVYNAVFICYDEELGIEKSLRLSSRISALYAKTLDFSEFTTSVKGVISNLEDTFCLHGLRLPWNERKSKNIYLAAPDFPSVNTKILNLLYENLVYHNFTPHLPIRENGLIERETNLIDQQKVYYKDLQLLQSCDLLIAIPLVIDSGTFIELGLFAQLGRPTILFDSEKNCDNLFAKFTPRYYCTTMPEVITSTFLALGRN